MNKTLAKLRNKKRVTIVVAGDSNTIISMNTQGRMNWTGYLQEALWERYGDGLVTMINVSECGFTFTRLPPLLESRVLRWQPDLVIFQLWLARTDDEPRGQAKGRAAFLDTVRRLRQASPAAPDILVCTPNPRVLCHGHQVPAGAEPGEVYECAEWNAARNAALVRLAREQGCTVVDHFTAWRRKTYTFAHPGANPRGLWQRMIDPVHPNALGQLMLFREMASVFGVAKYFPWEETPGD